MWNSPGHLESEHRKYRLDEISALVLPLDEMLAAIDSRSVAEVVDEAILQRMEEGEFIFTLYEVLRAMLEDVPVPEGGHTGVQEAMVAELLSQSFHAVIAEIELGRMDDFGDFGDPGGSDDTSDFARRSVWQTLDRWLIKGQFAEPSLPWILEDAGMKLSDAQPWLSEKMTPALWEELLLGEDFLCSVFLHDTDWRMGFLMDAHPVQAKAVAEMTGLNLEVVQALPHSPSEAEVQVAKEYIYSVIRKDEARYLAT